MQNFLSKIPVNAIAIVAGIIALAAIVYFYRAKQSKAKPNTIMRQTRYLVYGALCISLAFVLSNIRLFRMPQGGSITPVSMLPIMIYAFYFGPKYGFIASISYAFLQYIQDPFFLNAPQFMLDYIIGFGILGVASLFENLPIAVLVSGSLRTFASFLSGFLFFAEYAPQGTSTVIYSLLYQLTSIGIETLLCFGISIYLTKSKTFLNLINRAIKL